MSSPDLCCNRNFSFYIYVYVLFCLVQLYGRTERPRLNSCCSVKGHRRVARAEACLASHRCHLATPLRHALHGTAHAHKHRRAYRRITPSHGQNFPPESQHMPPNLAPNSRAAPCCIANPDFISSHVYIRSHDLMAALSELLVVFGQCF